MQRTPILLLASLLLLACGGDNASPTTHGAHNKPSEGGAAHSTAPPSNASDQTAVPAGTEQSTTYGQSGGASGGSQTSTQ